MRAGAVAIVATLLVACSSQSIAPPTPSGTPATHASVISSGCGSTPVLKGGIPKWLDVAGGYNNPSDLPYVITHPQLAAGFLFVYPLQAGLGQDVPNKILWVVRTPRIGPLTIDGHPLGSPSPTVHDARPANSGPGEIYPDGIKVPTPGCWQFDLRWASSHVQVELNYT